MAQHKGAEMYGRRNGRARHSPQTRAARRLRCISTLQLCKWAVLGIYLLMKLRLHSETGLWIYRYDSRNSCIVCRVLALWSGYNYSGDWFATGQWALLMLGRARWWLSLSFLFLVCVYCPYLQRRCLDTVFTSAVKYIYTYTWLYCTLKNKMSKFKSNGIEKL